MLQSYKMFLFEEWSYSYIRHFDTSLYYIEFKESDSVIKKKIFVGKRVPIY